tara:strand:+ start:695 stop:916 length:222 start_codon:yes stop_codon:yes gene_type:complete
MYIGCPSRKLDVSHEAFGIMHSLGVIKDQTLVEKVCLQGIEGGSKLRGELPNTFQIGSARFWFSRRINIRTGA